jgi:hypothetical protein
MRLSRLTLLLIIALPSGAIAQQTPKIPSIIEFTGEVTRGTSFVHDIGHGLLFRLTKTPGAPDMGWEIEIAPGPIVNPSTNAPATGEYEEFSGIVTPPYHFYNERYLETSYGTKAEEAVGITPREFNFVESVADSKAAYDVVESVLSSPTFPEKSEALAIAAAKIPIGTGELQILDSHITPGKDASDMGTIESVKFKVTLRLDSSQTLKDVLFPLPAR